jgi:hypothetical protein
VAKALRVQRREKCVEVEVKNIVLVDKKGELVGRIKEFGI